YAQSPWIHQVYLHANPIREYLLAVIVPAPTVDTGEALRDRLRHELGRLAAQAGLRGHEVPREFLVEPRPFTIDAGLLTDAGKLRRDRLRERYWPRLERLGVELEQRRARGAGMADGTASEKVRAALARTLGVAPARPWDESFVHLGADSLAAVEF